MQATYGKINNTLGPEYLFETSAFFILSTLDSSVSGGKLQKTSVPKKYLQYYTGPLLFYTTKEELMHFSRFVALLNIAHF